MILCMYDSYHALGGNGAISQLKNRMMELPNERNERRESGELRVEMTGWTECRVKSEE